MADAADAAVVAAGRSVGVCPPQVVLAVAAHMHVMARGALELLVAVQQVRADRAAGAGNLGQGHVGIAQRAVGDATGHGGVIHERHGVAAAEVFGLDDVLLIAHRVAAVVAAKADAAGAVGLARGGPAVGRIELGAGVGREQRQRGGWIERGK